MLLLTYKSLLPDGCCIPKVQFTIAFVYIELHCFIIKELFGDFFYFLKTTITEERMSV